MSIFYSRTIVRNFCFLLDKSNNEASDNGSGEQVEIWVSKETLAIASPVFEATFYGEFREANSEEPIYLPGKTEEDFVKFLNCLFPYSTQTDVDESNIEAVLRLSDEYQVEILIKKCKQYYERVIKSLRSGDEAVLNYLLIFFKYKFNDLVKLCVSYVAVLDVQALEQFRLQNKQSLIGYEHFLFTVYEVKLRRKSTAEHEWINYTDYVRACQKCQCRIKVDSDQFDACNGFHACPKNGSICSFCYDFDPACLNL